MTSPLSVSLDLLVCLSFVLLHRVSYNTHPAGSRSFLICARVSHPDLPAPTSSPAWHSLLVKQSASSLDLLAIISPWSNLLFTYNTPKGPEQSQFITDSLH